jgi:hypothetical protein
VTVSDTRIVWVLALLGALARWRSGPIDTDGGRDRGDGRTARPRPTCAEDRKTGMIAGYVDITGVHGMDTTPNGELLVGPGPEAKALQWFAFLATDGRPRADAR